MVFNLQKGDISKYIFKLVENELDMMIGLARGSNMGKERSAQSRDISEVNFIEFCDKLNRRC